MASSIKGTSVGLLNKGWEAVSNFPSSLKGLAAYPAFVAVTSAIASNLLYQRSCYTPEPTCITTPASGHLWWHVPEKTECHTTQEVCIESSVPYSLIVPAMSLVPFAVRLAAYSIGKMRSCCVSVKDRLSEPWGRIGKSFVQGTMASLDYVVCSSVDKISGVSAISIDNPWAGGLPELETLEAFKSRIIELRKPFCSSDPIASFVLPFIPDELNEVLIATNCKDPEEAETIFLGECHLNSTCSKLQGNVLRSLARFGGAVFWELNKGNKTVTNKSCYAWKFDGWDSRNEDKIYYYSYVYRKLHRESSVLLREVLSHLRKHEFQFVDEKFIQGIREKYSISNFSFLNEEEQQKLREEWGPKIEEAKSLNNRVMELALYLVRSDSALASFREKLFPWKPRQESLVSCLKHQLKPGKQLYIGGAAHFFDAKNKKLETTLAEGIETKRIKHITIIPKITLEEYAGDIIDTEEEGALDIYKIDVLFQIRLKELTRYIEAVA